MRLAVPLSAPGEAAALHEAGATEFYCGIQDAAWQQSFGDHDSISRRQGLANLPDIETLQRVVDECRALGAPLFLTLNANYTEAQMPSLLACAGAFEEMGGNGLMVADPALMATFRARGSRLQLGISLLAAVANSAALRFYRALGANRVVLPRFLRIEQIPALLQGHDDIEAESIVWLDKCPFIDGYCRFLHSVGYADLPTPSRRLRPSELVPSAFGIAPVRVIGFEEPAIKLKTWDMTYQLPACFDVFGYPPQIPACAACHLRSLAKAGVQVFKMGGRGRPLALRLAGVRFLRGSEWLSRDDIRVSYMAHFGTSCVPEGCYHHDA